MISGIALVTGGSGGIGRAIAEALAEAGCDIAVTGRDAERLDATCKVVEAHGRRALAIEADLREPSAVDVICGAVEHELGDITVLVNNAGTAPTSRLQKTTDSALDEVLDLHVKAPFRLIRRVLPEMMVNGTGVIVQLASSAGLRGFAFTSAYTAAKHAMVGLTRALAIELTDSGVRTFAVCPGFVDTEITRRAADAVAARGGSANDALAAMARLNRIGRMHSADEVGSAVAALCEELPDGCVYDLDSDPPRFVD